jgi:hypothetical protein
MSKAQIDSPDVIKGFRNHLVKFDEHCRQAVSGIRSDCDRTVQWVQSEQMHHWKQELRKSEELVLQAKSAYEMARFGSEAYRKTSFIDEQKQLRKAQARKEEAERKLTILKKWASLLAQTIEKQMGPIENLSVALELEVPKSIAKLDALVEALDAYLRDRPTPS